MTTLWVRFTVDAWDWHAGDVVELERATALYMLRSGKAVEAAGPIEAAAVEPAERAVKPRAQKRVVK